MTTQPTLREQQTAHVQEIMYRLFDVLTVLEMDQGLWYGGFPPSLEQLKNFVHGHARTMSEAFTDVVAEPRPDVG